MSSNYRDQDNNIDTSFDRSHIEDDIDNSNAPDSPFNDKNGFQEPTNNSNTGGLRSKFNSILRSSTVSKKNNKNKIHFPDDSLNDKNEDFEMVTNNPDDSASIMGTPNLSKDDSQFEPLNLKSAHFNDDSNENGEGNSSSDAPQRNNTVFKRHRWGTQRNKNGNPLSRNKTVSLRRGLSKMPHRIFSSNDTPDDDLNNEQRDNASQKREVYYNLPLPSHILTEDNLPPAYSRNKIRTTKYTPLSFLPKNIYFQFGNVANIFFLAMIILSAFQIFGVPNPALSAVPLIVIVILTSIKDAIEDSRRTISDLETNNQITHILKGIDNPQFTGENVSAWRKFKKLNSRLLFKIIGLLSKSTKINQLEETDNGPRTSMDSFDHRRSMANDRSNFRIDDDYNDDEEDEGYYVDEVFDNLPGPNQLLSDNLNNNNNKNNSESSLENPFGDSSSSSNALTKSITTESRYNMKPKPFKGPKSVLPPQSASSDTYPHFSKEYWKNIHVGDVIKVQNNDSIPVDLLILSTSDEDGACYVATTNLDGETNLKVKQALKCSSSDVRKVSDLTRCKFWLESEGPKSNLYSYEGNLKYYVNGDDRKGEIANEPVTINNLLLRGCTLKNTKWVVGVVVFTGDDTKIMLNAGKTPTKKSRIAKDLNYAVVINFVLLFVICFVSGLVNGIYYRGDNTSRNYFEYGTLAGSAVANGIVSFFVALILYQSLIPISLYISVEIIKTAQAFFIYSDVLMYYERLDYPCTPKSWNISDDLGQIEYIFSDKTGTLTQNVMETKKCTINGISYGRAYTEAYAGIRRRQGVDVEEESAREKGEIALDKVEMIEKLKAINGTAVSEYIDEELTFISKEFAYDLEGKSGDKQKMATEHFMLALALCHSVLTEKSEKKPGTLELKAQSPDEAALVATARDVGFAFTNRTKKGVILNVQGDEKEYQILNILEFNSTRKRMSTIIKIPPKVQGGEPTALLICKGADSIIYSRLGANNNQELLDKTAVHLEQYATEGLRTLCIAQREFSWGEYEDWQRRHNVAASSLERREERMEEVASSIECELTLLGGTAIEDRLQDGVPESISILAKAGLKIWVLTGDKVETAINIGFSCNLLETGMDLLVIKTSGEDIANVLGTERYENMQDDKVQIVQTLISKYLEENFNMTGSMDELAKAKGDHSLPVGQFGVIIDGDALKLALREENRIKFLLLCKQCKAVLCCRVSPAQKAAVVKLVKDTLEVITLAIGDGSNDVSMIQAANVGVGIVGEEGRQAAMSSDYAVGQFRYLSRLILVHGRWSYKRLAEMIPSFFYKNVVFTFALFWYGIYDDFDGTYLFEYTYLMFYSLAFTSLPVIFLGIFDQDVPDYVSLLVPQLYKTGILRTEWTMEKFYWYMIDGLYQSIISFFFPYWMYWLNGIVTLNGLNQDHRYFMGATIATIAIVSCDLYVLFHQYRWDWLSCLFVALSILVVFGWTGIWTSSLNSYEFYKAAAQLYGTPSFWACFFVGFLFCVIPRFSFDFVQKLWFPKDIDIVRECVSKGDFSQYPEDYDPTDPNRRKISNYAKDHTLEPTGTAASLSRVISDDQIFRDSINGAGGTRGSFVRRLFKKKNNKKKQNIVFPSSHSVDTLATEEIEMEFNHGTEPFDGTGANRIPSFSVKPTNDEPLTDYDRVNSIRNNIQKQRRSMEANRRSLDISRVRSLEKARREFSNGDERSNLNTEDLVRTSLDLPELTTAESLVGRMSVDKYRRHKQ
ncbi:hypothetical protein B5S28_g539 [[Candida] boidinii]|nr:hypothetical protein B5S28_g539 [[Candida] boidinii]OWB59166.1 hypothetical protein B5S29_g20 [[Candida] boidinii]